MNIAVLLKSKKYLIILLFLILSGNVSWHIYSYREKYIEKYDHKFWQEKYLKSQWVIPNSKEGLGDDGLYAYAGYEYILGKNPILINPEMPPLGKYLIGLFIVIFGNQNLFAIFSGIFCLIFLYWFAYEILQSSLLALFSVTFFSFEPLFYTQFSSSYLDLLYLTFLLGFLLFLSRKNFFFSMLFLGLMSATKNTFTSFFLGLTVSFIYLIFINRQKVKQLIFYLPVSFIPLFLAYFQFFLLGNSFLDFLKVQKYIFHFYSQGVKGIPYSIISILFLGNWPTWWGRVEKVSEWKLSWPVISSIAFIYAPLLFIKNKFNKLSLVYLWLIVYGLFLFFIPVWPRYLLLFIPFCYIVIIHFIKNVIIKKFYAF